MLENLINGVNVQEVVVEVNNIELSILVQKAGKGGIKCIYKNGDIDKKDCFNKKCEYFEGCDDDIDCDTGYCDPRTHKCGLEYECTKNELHNCDYNDCEELGENYHYNIEKGCEYYKIKNIIE